jgi:putative addiction module component (TIGR02574 family)
MEALTRDEIFQMSPPERLALIAELWNSLEQHPLPIGAAQRDELDRRLDSLEQDRAEGVTWATLEAELAERCP